MSYRQCFSIDISCAKGGDINDMQADAIFTMIEKISNMTWDVLSPVSFYVDDVRWWDCDRDLATLSHLYPDIRFDVFTDGEDSDDKSEITWINGCFHERWTEIPPFDPTKLVFYNGEIKSEFLPVKEDDNMKVSEDII